MESIQWKGINPILLGYTERYQQELLIFFSFIFVSWRLITIQYCSGFCHTLT